MDQENEKQDADRFEDLAKGGRPSLVAEFWFFLMHNKKWWLLPIIVIVVLLGALVLLAGSPLAPFIYPLF